VPSFCESHAASWSTHLGGLHTSVWATRTFPSLTTTYLRGALTLSICARCGARLAVHHSERGRNYSFAE
jgi:hypothetical protein